MSSYLCRSQKVKDRVVRFTNSDHKSWIVPIRGMRLALGLYQPSGVRGRLLKMLLPYLYWLSPLRRIICAESMQVRLNPQIEELVKKELNIDSFEFSIFEGTPSVHQKVTIQIAQEGRIIAYCKLSEDIDVVALFWRERLTLAQLHSYGVEHIPHCYYCGQLSATSDTTVFIQSTIKSKRSRVMHRWTQQHEQFLEELYQKTKVEVDFERSDFARSLKVLESYLYLFSSAQREVVEGALAQIRKHYGGAVVDFSALHGDFTPWNIFFECGELFAFDFEYAGMMYPPYLDRYHFMTQCAIYENHSTVDQIYGEFVSVGGSRIDYTSYLLDIISKYIHREDGAIVVSKRSNIDVWVDLIDRLW